MDALGGDCLIGADVNAHSTLWFNRRNDPKGMEVVDFINARSLVICNRDSRQTTFHGPRGQSNIDLTLASVDLARSVANWSILPALTASDHAGIRYEPRLIDPLSLGSVNLTCLRQIGRFLSATLRRG